ncbi:MAG: hypothetical protein JW990_21545 [Thermoleophilia bacterium]|nr:hypothetical protein [Thermoleophilia bacterium]
MKKPLAPRTKAALQAGFIAIGLGILAIPGLGVGLSGTASADATWTSLRVAALEAFTLITANIVMGAFRPFFVRVIKARTAHRLHVGTGIAGFALAVAHGVLAFVFGVVGYRPGLVWVGPAVLVLLAAVIVTALTRRRLRRAWRWIHRVNYLLFAVILAHGLILGYDLGGETLLKICFGIYAAMVAAGLGYRIAALMRRSSADA